MKKIVAALFAVILFLTILPAFSASAATVPTFEVGTVEGGAGKNVEVDVMVKNNPGIISVGLSIGYDEDFLELVSVEQADFKGSFQPSPTDRNPITVNWITLNNNTQDGVVAKLYFTINNGVEIGDSTEITIDYAEDDVFDENFDNVTFETVNGSVTVICLHKNTTIYPADPSTCTHQGKGAYTFCNDCETVIEGSDALLPLKAHEHNNKIVADKHLKSGATCTAPAIYYYSCVCGNNGTATFENGKALGHTFDNDADTECNRCSTKFYPGGNTLVSEGGKWYHVTDRKKVTDTTLVQYSGTWYYVKDGVVDFSATTLVKYNNKWWYVKDGKMSKDNTLVQYNGVWYHVNGGNTVTDTTIVEYNGASYHVIDGIVDFNAHSYTKQITTDKYLKSAANCTAAAVYYHSCECGAKGTTTFASGTALGHKYDNDADTDCNVCNTEAYPGGNTLVNEGGKWYHIVNRKKVTDTTLVSYGGVWYYVKNGVVDFSATTLVSYNGKMWYVKAGKMARDNTLIQYNGVWYHVNNGTTVTDTTIVEYNGASYHVINGIVNFNAHTYNKQVATAKYLKSAANCTSAAVYYYSCDCGTKGTTTFTSGKALGHKYDHGCDASCNVCKATRTTSHKYSSNADTSCDNCGAVTYSGGNTLVNEGGKWYHIVNRKKVNDTTLVSYGGVWYYVKNGVVDFSATTLVSYNGKMWYVKAGKMARDNTLVNYGGVWYHVNGGNTTSNTTLVSYGGVWYYVKSGKVDFSATTLVSYNGKMWYVKAGKMARDNTLVKYNNVWYHVNGGNTITDTTLVKYSGVWYCVRSGKVDFNYSGSVNYNGKAYKVVKGKLA